MGIVTALSVASAAMFTVAVNSSPPASAIVLGAETVFAALMVAQVLVLVSGWRAHTRDQVAVARLERQFSAAAASSGGWVYVIDPDGRIVYSSDACRDLLGYEPVELLGKDARDLLSPLDADHLDSRVGYVPQHVNRLVVRGRHRDGHDVWFECTIAPVLGADNQDVIGFSGTARVIQHEQNSVVARELHRRTTTAILDSGELVIHFQPIVDLTTGATVGAEALSRFPTQPGKSPEVVFGDAFDAGLGPDLELLAVRRALQEAALLDPGLYVAVNVSPAVLGSTSLTDVLRASGVDLRRVVVEVTEHASVADYTQLEKPRQRLRELGVRLAVDDAGAGYASLRHIVSLAPDIIKLDRALVADIDADRARRALVMAVVVYAIEIGTTLVVGEGVETAAELNTLKSLGVDAAQGYLTGRPTGEPSDWLSWRAATPATRP